MANQAMKEGIKYYLLKPTSEEEIISTLKKVILEMKEKDISHDKISLLFNAIINYVHNSSSNAANEEVKNFFSIIAECKTKKAYVDYCVELFILIIRQCEDYNQVPKYLRKSSEFDISTALDKMYNIFSKTIVEIININKIINSLKYSKYVLLIIKYIDDNISNEELSLSYISNHLFMNSDYI